MAVARIESLVMGSHPVTRYVVCRVPWHDMHVCRVPRPPTARAVRRAWRAESETSGDGARAETGHGDGGALRSDTIHGKDGRGIKGERAGERTRESGVPPAKIVLETLRKKFQEKICM
jgi:hypothetical protein